MQLARQRLAVVLDPPSLDTWNEMCRCVADLVLFHLKQVALNSLNANHRWSAYLRIAEEALRDRGIDLDRYQGRFSVPV